MSKIVISNFRNFRKTEMLMTIMNYQKWYVDLFSPKGLLIIRNKL